MILAAITRNAIGFVSYKVDDGEDQSSGKWENGMAMISLKLWELQSLALPLIVILASQVVMMALFAYLVAIIGAMFADLINTGIISLFLNMM